ncbi:MAG: hypothetical protein J0M07_06285 [Anaerolineae bacterium]|nr:hypothetical protein [Anaerolineae bacterium]
MLESRMFVQNSLSPKTTLELVVKAFDKHFELHERVLPDEPTVVDALDGHWARLTCDTMNIESRFVMFIHEQLGFRPNLRITFDAKNPEYELGLIRFINSVARDPNWSLALTLHDSFVILVKRGLEIHVNEELRGSSRLELFRFPYEVRPINRL